MKVLVIGAGASGLPAIKTALEYGFNTTCMEKSNDIGGLWRYKSNPQPAMFLSSILDEGTVMRSTVINTSKEMTAYSDFPPPSSAANFMHNSEMLEYLRSYAEHFRLIECIKFKHEVVNIERAKGFDSTAQWNVTYQNLNEPKVSLKEVFDGIMVCTGHHSIPYWPQPFPGQSCFKGTLVHSHSFGCATPFENQIIVVVGIGNSGGDIAVELSKVAKKVYLSTRSGSWIMNRVWDYGEPTDLVLLNRFTYALKAITPRSLQNKVLERKLNKRFDHGRFGICPNHRFLEAHVTVNDELPNRIISGTVVVKSNISKFNETSIIFEDGSEVADVDAVIFATGYSFAFPILENGQLIEVNNNRVLLYKFMFPIELAPNNSLAIIGLIQPTGSIMPISEMQCRVYCAQLSRSIILPSQSEMLIDALQTILINKKHFIDRRRHTLQVHYVTYMESLAKMLKVKPNILKFLFTDPKLAGKLVFHGLVPYQYRLQGDHNWSEARKALLELEERVFYNTQTRITDKIKQTRPNAKTPQFLIKILI